jgi:hypothetical protein
MTIQITVIDPANTPRADLALVISVLQRFHDAGANVAPLPPVAALDPDDNPAAGVDVQTPGEAFGNAGALEAFGAASGNGAPGLPLTPPAGTLPALPNGSQTAGASTLANGVEVDATGLPWDQRIHAGTKTKKADGTWTARRGVEPATVAVVTAELRQLMSLPTPTPGNVPPTAGASVTPPAPPAPVMPTPPAPPAPTTAPAAHVTIPTAPAGVPPLPPTTGIDFAALAKMIGELIPAGRLTQDQLAAITQKYGVPQFGLLFNRPDLVPAVHADIVAAIGG